MQSNIKVGDVAPDFTLAAANGTTVRLSDYRGKKSVVLFFYPKDETPGCTVEACTFRDSYEEFAEAGAEVIGISADSSDSHVKFAGRHNLPMLLLSDPEGEARAKYGVKPMLGIGVLAGRVTFVIDREGIVRHVKAARFEFKSHVTESLAVLKQFSA
jgi:peroxiredoxin Q/BCP